ncbi:hypothetical protein SAMN05421734_105187 [Pelagirhabdus alkalitolerans]|uniref:Uncharacterized protein n=1 Tax=Pelagirhabdus alkalitolerans TaxID=1612202 RepID=A0A1G6JZG2_9BACI|nr:hypothetical protein [Pelagirhabdus alkalitolerans]SDC23775.1 hypothetical protein SAMN05421734_105187 [Pelagirhabdus alkalitolerans]
MERLIILIPAIAFLILLFYAGFFLLENVFNLSKEVSSVIAGAISGIILLTVSTTTLENPPYFLLTLFFVFLLITFYQQIKKSKSRNENDSIQK